MLKKLSVLLGISAVFTMFAAGETAAKLDYAALTVPTLKPVGSGNMKNSVVHYVLRNQQVLFFCLKDGESINLYVKHFGNKSRPTGISYVILDQQKNELKKGVISYSTLERIVHKVEKGGTYAMVISSGTLAAPWYTVSSKTPFTALSAAGKEIYLFGPQSIFVPGKALGNNNMQVRLGPKESYTAVIDGGEKQSVTTAGSKLLDMPDKAVVKVVFGNLPKPAWGQNFHISFPGNDRTPFIFYGPERAVEIVK